MSGLWNESDPVHGTERAAEVRRRYGYGPDLRPRSRPWPPDLHELAVYVLMAVSCRRLATLVATDEVSTGPVTMALALVVGIGLVMNADGTIVVVGALAITAGLVAATGIGVCGVDSAVVFLTDAAALALFALIVRLGARGRAPAGNDLGIAYARPTTAARARPSPKRLLVWAIPTAVGVLELADLRLIGAEDAGSRVTLLTETVVLVGALVVAICFNRTRKRTVTWLSLVVAGALLIAALAADVPCHPTWWPASASAGLLAGYWIAWRLSR